MATTVMSTTEIEFKNSKQHDKFMNRITSEKPSSLNHNVKETRDRIQKIKSIKIDGKVYKV